LQTVWIKRTLATIATRLGIDTMFHVIDIDNQERLTSELGEPLEFTNGREAAEAAGKARDDTGRRFQPRRAAETVAVDWRARERARFADGTYQPLPVCLTQHWLWADNPQIHADHFAHVSTEDGAKIAFTESDERGIADRQTSMTIGRYLTRYFSEHASAETIRTIATLFASEYEKLDVRFARTPDEIEHVYVNGPRSCMSHEGSAFAARVHPARVYGAGDLAIVYLQLADESITARALVWPEHKVYARIYGDECRLERLLVAEGYTEGDNHDFEGAKVLKIEYNSGYVMPYLDVCGGVDHSGSHFTLARHGDIDCQTTNGVVGDHYATCDHCDDNIEHEDGANSVDGETWCDHCTENHTFYCDYHGERFSGDDYVLMHNGECWSADAFSNHGATCEATDQNLPEDQCVTLSDGTVWSRRYFERNGFECPECGDMLEEGPCCSEAADAEACEHHMAEAGRDESPEQAELPLATPSAVYHVGDVVEVHGVGRCVVDFVDANDALMPVRVRAGSGVLFWPRAHLITHGATTPALELA
jgi:hypothetical protein